MGSLHVNYEDTREFVPDKYPPFPKDAQPVVELETFSHAELQKSQSERAKLLDVCQTRGFFYLDLKGTPFESLANDAESVGHLSEKVFQLPMEEKLRHKFPGQKPRSVLGYKIKGWTKVDEKGTVDTAEFMNVGKDDILDNPERVPVKLPSICLERNNRALLARYQKDCHRIGMDILSILASELDLPSDIFEDKHRISKPSDDHVRMTRGPPRQDASMPEIQTPGHTDFGTITVLFNWLGGLQVWSEPSRGNFFQLFDGEQNGNGHAKNQWLWVKPKPGCAIVNLGDAAVKFTGGALCSGRHRVVPAPGDQGLLPRYSVVYFVRPEDKCILKRFVGGMVPPLAEGEVEEEMEASMWIFQQALMLNSGVAKGS